MKVITTTLAQAEARFDVKHFDYLDKQAEVPTVSELGFQGDVAIIRRAAGSATTPIPATGYVVVRGENGGNTHALFGPGLCDPTTRGDLCLLTVPADAQVLLSHPEHGGLLIQPGTYVLRRQREQADEIRMVAD
jgi:hypothetical protein